MNGETRRRWAAFKWQKHDRWLLPTSLDVYKFVILLICFCFDGNQSKQVVSALEWWNELVFGLRCCELPFIIEESLNALWSLWTYALTGSIILWWSKYPWGFRRQRACKLKVEDERDWLSDKNTFLEYFWQYFLNFLCHHSKVSLSQCSESRWHGYWDVRSLTTITWTAAGWHQLLYQQLQTFKAVGTRGCSRTIKTMFNDNCWPWNFEKAITVESEGEKKRWSWLIYSLVSSQDGEFIRWKMKINYITIFLSFSEAHTKNENVVVKNDDTLCLEEIFSCFL